jgi:perosamine synthetase
MRFTTAFPYFPEDEIDWILNEFRTILRGDGMLSMGRHVKAFEKEFADYVGQPFAVGTNSCSAALEIALRSIELAPDDEVIVPVQTFIATGAVVIREGGRPVFAEVSPDTFCLTIESFKEKITTRTRAVILVHMAGLITPDVHEIRKFCDSKNIVLIEDAAHACGASIGGSKAGSLGHIGCFSFFPTKMMTTAEGGMLVTADEKLYKKADSFRNRGLDLDAGSEQYSGIGTNNRMTEIAAIMGRSQLRCLEDFVKKRNQVAAIYNEAINRSELNSVIRLTKFPNHMTHAYWRYLISLSPKINREKLRDLMLKDEIGMDWAYYPPLHLQPVFVGLYGHKAGMLPQSETLLEHHVCLPMHACIDSADANFIVKTFLSHTRELLNKP